MTVLRIKTARVFHPLLEPARYKGAHGGRGSGKSHFFGEMLVERCLLEPGMLAVGIREVQKTLAQSSKRLIESKIESLGVGRKFRVWNDKIETPGDGLIIFQGMQDHTAESIKSLEGYKIAWVEEAQTLSTRSLTLLRPTIRVPKSELWFSWNPRRKVDAVDDFLRAKRPEGAVVVEANWRDNPWFPDVLEKERQTDLAMYPERYEHIWEGDYAKAFEGAYFAKGLALAKQQGRIGRVAADPLLPLRAYWDLGGAGATADAMAIWIVQFVGQEIRVLDYIEGVGQVLAYYVSELRARGYDRIHCVLPHDGVNSNVITGKRYEDHLRDAGFSATVVPNQGRGAAMMRIEAVRRLFPKIWFNEATTEAGRDALGYYHERKDEERNVGLGPDHDWSSHCFIGETEVLTRYGKCQIRNLPESGEVLTPCGLRPYTHPRVTRRNAQLVEVLFADGHTVKCTPDHLFLTATGWKSAELLLPTSLIRSSLMQRHSILTAVSIGAGLANDIIAEAERSCIAMFWRGPLGRFLKGVTSITATITQTIMHSQIWSVWKLGLIFGIHGATDLNQNTCQDSISATLLDRGPLNGMLPRRAASGIGGMQSGPKVGPNGSESQKTAQNAERHSQLSLEKAGIRRFIAVRPAKWLRIAGVRRLSERQDVWCLTVPDGNCFSLANGAVVHNCADAFGLMAISYRDPLVDDDDQFDATARGRSEVTGY